MTKRKVKITKDDIKTIKNRRRKKPKLNEEKTIKGFHLTLEVSSKSQRGVGNLSCPTNVH